MLIVRGPHRAPRVVFLRRRRHPIERRLVVPVVRLGGRRLGLLLGPLVPTGVSHVLRRRRDRHGSDCHRDYEESHARPLAIGSPACCSRQKRAKSGKSLISRWPCPAPTLRACSPAISLEPIDANGKLLRHRTDRATVPSTRKPCSISPPACLISRKS